MRIKEFPSSTAPQGQTDQDPDRDIDVVVSACGIIRSPAVLLS